MNQDETILRCNLRAIVLEMAWSMVQETRDANEILPTVFLPNQFDVAAEANLSKVTAAFERFQSLPPQLQWKEFLRHTKAKLDHWRSELLRVNGNIPIVKKKLKALTAWKVPAELKPLRTIIWRGMQHLLRCLRSEKQAYKNTIALIKRTDPHIRFARFCNSFHENVIMHSQEAGSNKTRLRESNKFVKLLYDNLPNK